MCRVESVATCDQLVTNVWPVPFHWDDTAFFPCSSMNSADSWFFATYKSKQEMWIHEGVLDYWPPYTSHPFILDLLILWADLWFRVTRILDDVIDQHSNQKPIKDCLWMLSLYLLLPQIICRSFSIVAKKRQIEVSSMLRKKESSWFVIQTEDLLDVVNPNGPLWIVALLFQVCRTVAVEVSNYNNSISL